MREMFVAELRALIKQHCETMKRELCELNRMLDGLDGQGGDRLGAAERSLRLAHRLKGSSGTIGFTSVSEASQALETALRGIVSSGRAPDRPQLQGIHRLASELALRIVDIEPAQSRLYRHPVA